MLEYIINIRAAAVAVGMSSVEVQALANATHAMVVELRRRLADRHKMLWLNGVDNANPLPLIDDHGTPDSNCSQTAPWQCGWWNDPKPGERCVQFFQSRCANQTLGKSGLGVLKRGSWELSIAALLLLRQASAWLAPSWWLPGITVPRFGYTRVLVAVLTTSSR